MLKPKEKWDYNLLGPMYLWLNKVFAFHEAMDGQSERFQKLFDQLVDEQEILSLCRKHNIAMLAEENAERSLGQFEQALRDYFEIYEEELDPDGRADICGQVWEEIVQKAVSTGQTA